MKGRKKCATHFESYYNTDGSCTAVGCTADPLCTAGVVTAEVAVVIKLQQVPEVTLHFGCTEMTGTHHTRDPKDVRRRGNMNGSVSGRVMYISLLHYNLNGIYLALQISPAPAAAGLGTSFHTTAYRIYDLHYEQGVTSYHGDLNDHLHLVHHCCENAWIK